MALPCGGGEHHGIARTMGAETKLRLRSCECFVHGRNRAGVPCASQVGLMRAIPVPRECRGYVAPSPLCVDGLAAEPPAHCRLSSGHDPSRWWPPLIVTAPFNMKPVGEGESA